MTWESSDWNCWAFPESPCCSKISYKELNFNEVKFNERDFYKEEKTVRNLGSYAWKYVLPQHIDTGWLKTVLYIRIRWIRTVP
jgi:hypothetical protein